MRLLPVVDRTVVRVRDEYKYAWIINVLGQSEYLHQFRIFFILGGILVRILLCQLAAVTVYTIALWKFSNYNYFMFFDINPFMPSKRFKTLVLACAIYAVTDVVIKFDYDFLQKYKQ